MNVWLGGSLAVVSIRHTKETLGDSVPRAIKEKGLAGPQALEHPALTSFMPVDRELSINDSLILRVEPVHFS